MNGVKSNAYVMMVTKSQPVKNKKRTEIQTAEPKIKCNNGQCAFQKQGHCQLQEAHLEWTTEDRVVCKKFQYKV